MKYLYQHAILGGTFDHFHAGHKQLIAVALQAVKRLTLGIVESELPSNKSHPNLIEAYPLRLSCLTTYLAESGLLARVNIIPIHDIYGTSLTDRSIEAIFVTDSTSSNAELINVERTKLALPPLKIILTPYALGDDGEIISSGRIRAGLIDRNGNSYLKFLLTRPVHHLPESLRKQLKHPIGPAVKDISQLNSHVPSSSLIISVGDIVSLDLQKSTFHPSISIIDYHTERHEFGLVEIHNSFPIICHELTNTAGTINSQIGDIFLSSLNMYFQTNQTQVIAVDGEEDLLTIPSVLLSPLNSYVIYGQSRLGMIVTKVTEKLKGQIKILLDQFS